MKALFSFLKTDLPRHIEMDRDPARFAVQEYIPTTQAPRINDLLSVRDGEAAALLEHGRVLRLFEAGLYELDLAELADLAGHYSWPTGYNGPVQAELYYVSGFPQLNRPWQTPPGNSRFSANGKFTFTISDPVKLLNVLQDNGVKTDDSGLCVLVSRSIVNGLRRFLDSTSMTLDQLQAVPKDVCNLSRRSITDELEIFGISEFSFTIKSLHGPEETERPPDNTDKATVVVPESKNNRFEVFDEYAASTDEPLFKHARLSDELWEKKFYVVVDGKQTGPFDAEEFQHAVRDGSVLPTTLVWYAGLENWLPAGRIPGITQMFSLE